MVETNPTGTGKNRMLLLLIGGIPLTMILTATWLWFFVAHVDLDLIGVLGTANRGTLVQPPRQINDVTLRNEDGMSTPFADLESRWTMLIPSAGGRCDTACEKSLYVTRQIHIAMGKEFNRLRRLYVSESSVKDTALVVAQLSDQRPTPADFGQYLMTEHRGLKSLTLSAEDYIALFAESANNPATWYLVDPAGWIMMSYNDEVPYKDVISDLKFLLKNSGG